MTQAAVVKVLARHTNRVFHNIRKHQNRSIVVNGSSLERGFNLEKSNSSNARSQHCKADNKVVVGLQAYAYGR
eukprot:16316-Heterococcus_DN1.PRE.2